MSDIEIAIPHGFIPRPYQLAVWNALDGGIRRALLCWHRRAGKDKLCFNWMVKEMCERVGYYVYLFPSYAQGKKALWEAIDKDGFRVIDHIPKALRDGEPNSTEMKVRLWNGSLFQVLGTDQIDSLVGTNPIGIVFSEQALQDPQAWELMRPILAENGGWAIFNSTPRGRNNHFYRMFTSASKSDKWFVSFKTVDDTNALTPEAIAQEREDGMDEETFLQEFFCSWSAGMSGAYYATLMEAMQREKRITDVPYDPTLPVDTWWDIGVGDSTVIIFVQTTPTLLRIIDYYEKTGEGLAHYVKLLSQKPYLYEEHVAPHDIGVREWGGGAARIETAANLGVRFKIARKLPIDDGISAVRMMLPLCYIDKEKCAHLIDALGDYRKEYDPKTRTYRNTPYHSWSSHPADATRTGAVGRKRAVLPRKVERYQIKEWQHERSWMSV